MAMTNQTQNPAPPNTLSLSAQQAKDAAAKLQAEAKVKEDELRAAAVKLEGGPLDVAQPVIDTNVLATNLDKSEDEADLLSSAAAQFKDEVQAEEIQSAKVLAAQIKSQTTGSTVAIHDLTEDDAYNLEVAIVSKNMGSPDFLKVVLKDRNYVARWCNRNPIRMSQLAGQGFRMIKKDEVVNLDSLDMFQDAQGNFVYADLVAMKIPKNIYYAGLRRAYLKSLHATQNKKAAEAGAAFASARLQGELSGSERSYMAEHEAAGMKPIYNPNLGV